MGRGACGVGGATHVIAVTPADSGGRADAENNNNVATNGHIRWEALGVTSRAEEAALFQGVSPRFVGRHSANSEC